METLDVHKNSSLFDMNDQGVNISVLELMRGDHHISKDELNKSLMSACKHGHKLLVQMLVGRGADVNYRDTNGNTPLLISVQNRFTDIVLFLLRNKADVNACNSVGNSALILSIHSSGSTEITEYLLKQPGINIDHQNQDGYTAIMKAAEVRDVDAMKILLDYHHKKHSVSVYETVDDRNAYGQTSDSFSNVIFKWTILDETVNCKEENVHQIAKKCGIGDVFQLLQKHVETNISPLELAMRANDIKSFLIFLDCDFIYAANKKKYVDETLKQIFKACSNKDITDFSEDEIAMVKALLEHGADVNTTWRDKSFILDRTCDFDREQAGSHKSESLYNPFSLAQRPFYCAREVTPLLIAAKSGCFRVVQLLLSFKAEVKRFAFRNSPLHVTLSYGHTECAKLLIQYGGIIDFNLALELAVDQQEPKYVRFLIENYENEIMEHLKRFSHFDEILIRSVRKGSLEIVGQILDLGADINGTTDPDLCPLVESKNGEVAKFLINRGANVKHVRFIKQKRYPSPLIKILKRRDCEDNSVVEVIQVLLENGASVNDKCGDGKTPLMLAAEKVGNKCVLQLLLDHGAELGEVDKQGNTALMHAVQNCSLLNVSFLLQFMKDREELLNVQNDEGLTALMLAVNAMSQTIVKELIDHSADVNIKDRKGNTALLHLLLASDKDKNEMIKSLIQAGCEVNWQNNDGLSPLMVAAQTYLIDTMSVLLDSGAEVNAVSKIDDAKTALTHVLYIPYEDDYFSCLDFLLDRGASSSYMEATTFHKIIVAGQCQIVPKLIRCGLGPVSFVTSDMDFSDLAHKIMFSRITHSVVSTAHNTYSYSPLFTALCVGNNDLARFFVGNLFLAQSDISLLGHNKLLRQHLERQNFKESLEILNEISTQPMSLFNLSFVAVSTAVGTVPGRENRVNKLPVPQIIKDKLLFKKQDVALTVSETDFRPMNWRMLTTNLVGKFQTISFFDEFYSDSNPFYDYHVEDYYDRHSDYDYNNYYSYDSD